MTGAPGLARQHFCLLSMQAVARVLRGATEALGSPDDLFEQFPFLAGYRQQLADLEVTGSSTEPLDRMLNAFEATHEQRLPLLRLARSAQLDRAGLVLLVAIGLVEEDARFGSLFARLQGAAELVRPTFGLLGAWWQGSGDREEVWCRLRRLMEVGVVDVVNPTAPRASWGLAVPGALWDAAGGEPPSMVPWLRHHLLAALAQDGPLIVPPATAMALERVAALLRAGEADGVVVRGHRHNGRRTFVRALARLLGRGVLEIDAPDKDEAARWRLLGPLRVLLDALPVVVAEVPPAETLYVPAPLGGGALAVVTGRTGALTGPGVERSLQVDLALPDPDLRRQHWTRALGEETSVVVDAISERFRMTSGMIRRGARLARAHAAAAGRPAIQIDDVRKAARSLRHDALDLLAVPLPAGGSWSDLAVSVETMRDLRSLESRCRHRERLADHVGPALAGQLNPGVRGLFQGPSGTGKTLSVRLLAAALQMDLYRVDLSAVVSKYIGETEKNLDRLFALAEELDVMLLLDEGDALLGRRTGVTSANDRYANLETNFLLQRLEAFEGIVMVTTNSPNIIDEAFQRRLDVVVEFRPPEPAERWAIWQLHLPVEHGVDPQLLREVAARCTFNGGQIRNAVLHAAMLALDEPGERLRTEHLEEALLREYRKMGAICPVRRLSAVAAAR
jgi:hypothetical protein